MSIMKDRNVNQAPLRGVLVAGGGWIERVKEGKYVSVCYILGL
jgi:hypothetical protein